MPDGLDGVKAALARRHSYLVTAHVDPDPDAIGSIMALVWALRQRQVEAVAAVSDPLPSTLLFLPGSERIQSADDLDDKTFDCLVVLDSEVERTGKLAKWAEHVQEVINIDHHVTNAGSGDVNWINPDAAATGEMVWDLIQAWGLNLDSYVGSCLYAAIAGDTGSFRYSNATPKTYRIAAQLVAVGVRQDEISENLFERKPWSYLQMLRAVLETLRRSKEGKIAWIELTLSMAQAAGIDMKEVEGFVNYPRMIEDVQLAVLVKEVDQGKTKVSFRSRDGIDSSEIAAHFGGGGHQKAAGCTIHRPLAEAKEQVLTWVFQVLEDSE